MLFWTDIIDVGQLKCAILSSHLVIALSFSYFGGLQWISLGFKLNLLGSFCFLSVLIYISSHRVLVLGIILLLYEVTQTSGFVKGIY